MWTRTLIDCVREQTILYDGSFKDKVKKEAIWIEICHDINRKHQLHIKEIDCERRWKLLRDKFAREHRKLVSMSSMPGQTQDSTHKEWLWYRKLSFLKDYLRPRKSVTSSNVPANVKIKTSSSPIPSPISGNDEIMISDEELNEEEVANFDSLWHSPEHSVSTLQTPVQPKYASSTSSISNYPAAQPEPQSNGFHRDVQDNPDVKNASVWLESLKFHVKSMMEFDGYLQCMRDAWKDVPLENRNRCMADILHVMDKFKRPNK